MKVLPIFCCVALVFNALLSCQNQNGSVAASLKDSVPPLNKSLAVKPPMGWNSWNCFGWAATEAEIRANAEYIAKNLKGLGYEYIVIDQGWFADSIASDFDAFAADTMTTKPHFTMDEFGRLAPDPIKYPSSVGGKGFKPLADYIHSLGLKFGLHYLRGIPWEAAEKNLIIKGTTYKTLSIAQPDKGCDWYDGFYGVDMSKPGAQEYYNSVYKQCAEWGVDFIKADDLINEPELEGVSKAIRTSGRDMVISIVGGDIPFDVQMKNAHMARTGFDFWDVWQMLKVGFPVAAKAVSKPQPGFWPDLDMLPIGKIGIKISYKGPEPRISRFTKDELHSLFSLWYISKMPLFIGAHLPETDTTTIELLSNKEALEVNRNSINNRQIKFKNAVIIWAADIPNSTDKYLAFFNQWETKQPVNIKVAFQQLGLDSTTAYKIRDLWQQKDLGSFKNEFAHPIIAHGASLFRISK